MQRSDLEEHLNNYLQISLFKDYCPNGLQVEGKKEVKRVATAVSSNLLTLQKAIEQHVDALIVHHGLFWNHSPYPIIGTLKRKMELLLHNEISLFCYHLPLDAHKEVGNNWQAARELGWEDLEAFCTYNGIEIGVKGTFAPQAIETFVADVEAYYEHNATVALGGKRSVASGALISGGAYKDLLKAAQVGVDCFITGNFDEPAWNIAHEEQIHFLALGHYSTETVGPKALSEYIKNTLRLDSFFLDIPNPF